MAVATRLSREVKPLEVKSDGGVLVLSVSEDGLGVYVAVNVGVLRVSRFIPASTMRRVYEWCGRALRLTTWEKCPRCEYPLQDDEA